MIIQGILIVVYCDICILRRKAKAIIKLLDNSLHTILPNIIFKDDYMNFRALRIINSHTDLDHSVS